MKCPYFDLHIYPFVLLKTFVETVLSFVSAQWTKERNNLSERTVLQERETHRVVPKNKALRKQTVRTKDNS